MKTFIRTILVMVVCLAVFSSPVTAQAPTPVPFIVPPGGIAIVGFNFDDPDQFAFVCLVDIPSGTEIRFTDKGWTDNQDFGQYESIISWYTPGGCDLGQIITINPSEHKTNTSGDWPFDFSSNGDQIFVYQYISSQTHLVFGLNSKFTNWQSSSDGTSKLISTLPTIFTTYNPRPAIALNEIDNSIYTGPTSFTTTTAALAAIVNVNNWSGDNSVRQNMPTGPFLFTTTAVHLSEFSAETGGESAPWWVLLGLVIVPVLVMVFKRPKKDCCK